MHIRMGQIREALQSLLIRLELIYAQTIKNGRENMYYTNINDYEQLLNTNKAKPAESANQLIIITGFIMALLLIV